MSSHTVQQVVFDLFRSFGMTTIFGNPGSTELPMFRNFPADFRYVLGLQEMVAIGMADGYAQATRNAGLVNLHSATGLGHALGSVFTAYKNQTPLVITAGQQARSILPFEPFLFARKGAGIPAALRQMELRASASGGCPGGDRTRLLHRDAAAARTDFRLNPSR
jgi:benzoylformate decarboxylase